MTTAFRSPLLPELPTVAEFVPGYEASSWYGLSAPKNTSGEIIDLLNREINAALSDPTIAERFASMGGSPLAGAPSEFQRLLVEKTDKWGRVVRFANAKPQ